MGTAIKDFLDNNPKKLMRVELDRKRAYDWLTSDNDSDNIGSFRYCWQMTNTIGVAERIKHLIDVEEYEELDLIANALMLKIRA